MIYREARLCPHCSKPLTPIRFGASISPFAARLIDTIERAGGAGVSANDLLKAVYSDRRANLGTLRSYISALNVALAPRGVAIRSDRSSTYRIIVIGKRRA